MLSLFRKKKIYNAVKENAVQERVANSFVSVCIRFQEKWANLMQGYAERLSLNGKIIMLFLFCLSAVSLSLYLILGSMQYQSAPSFTITHFKASPFAQKAGDENTKAPAIVSKAEYERINHFQLYMDSLAKSTMGKRLYDSILNKRPGLMDSIMIIEELYKAKK